MSSTPIIIISLSGRGLAQALNAAGFRVAVVDLFGDVDTQALAERVIRIEAREGFRLDPEQTLGALQTLTAEGFGPRVIVGSGFEDALELHGEISARYQVLGADTDILRQLHSRTELFSRLGARVDVPLTAERPRGSERWLAKYNGGSGGWHVTTVSQTDTAPEGDYFQAYKAGNSLSAIGLADEQNCALVAVNEHLVCGTNVHRDYRYTGAVSVHDIKPDLIPRSEHALTEVANLTGLRGCFGIDFIYGRDGVLWVVDVNPRPPATLALCADRAAVMQQHVAVCSGRRLLYSRPETTHCRAHWVVYSNAAWVVPDRFTWPDAVADIPRAGATVAAQHPLCTLETEARSDVEATATLEREFRNLAKALGRDADRVMGAKINIKRVGEE